jgi:hypothetical protein
MIPAGVNWATKPRLWTGALRTRLRGSFGVASSEAATVLPAVGPSPATILSNLLKKFIDIAWRAEVKEPSVPKCNSQFRN